MPPGASPLAFERESYNPSTGAVIFWVKVPWVSHTTDSAFYMLYGNSSITTDQSNKTGVWDSDYQGICTSQRCLASKTIQPAMATFHSVSLTSEGSATVMTGGADQFNASHPDHIDLPNIVLTSAFTLES